jgi:hypothetical protein
VGSRSPHLFDIIWCKTHVAIFAKERYSTSHDHGQGIKCFFATVVAPIPRHMAGFVMQTRAAHPIGLADVKLIGEIVRNIPGIVCTLRPSRNAIAMQHSPHSLLNIIVCCQVGFIKIGLRSRNQAIELGQHRLIITLAYDCNAVQDDSCAM